jgi:hypothetical protein
VNAAARALEALPLTSASSSGGTSESTKSWSWPECDSACYGSRKVGNSCGSLIARFHLHRIREDQAMSAADNREFDEIVRGSEIELGASRIIAACRQSK